ncbi:MAG: hypothetical protein ACLS37_08215 [Alistipes sp.]
MKHAFHPLVFLTLVSLLICFSCKDDDPVVPAPAVKITVGTSDQTS